MSEQNTGPKRKKLFLIVGFVIYASLKGSIRLQSIQKNKGKEGWKGRRKGNGKEGRKKGVKGGRGRKRNNPMR